MNKLPVIIILLATGVAGIAVILRVGNVLYDTHVLKKHSCRSIEEKYRELKESIKDYTSTEAKLVANAYEEHMNLLSVTSNWWVCGLVAFAIGVIAFALKETHSPIAFFVIVLISYTLFKGVLSWYSYHVIRPYGE